MGLKLKDIPVSFQKGNNIFEFSLQLQQEISPQSFDSISLRQVGSENQLNTQDTVLTPGNVKPPVIEHGQVDDKEQDTIPEFDESAVEKSVIPEDADTVSGKGVIQDKAETDLHDLEESGEIAYQHQQTDSDQYEKAGFEYFEKPDNVIIPYDPAVKYFGKHHLEPQNPVTMIDKAPSNDWAFPVMVFSLLMIAFVKYFFYNRLKEFVFALFATRFFYQMERKGNIFREWISIMLVLNFLVVFSLLIWQTLDHLSATKNISFSRPLQIMIIVLLMAACFLFVKYYFIRLLGWVFKTYYVSDAYFNNIIVFNMLIGVVLIPFVHINIYIASGFLLYASWVIFAVANLFKIIRGLYLAYNTAQFSGYYLFLYICGVELAPLLIIARFSANYLNIV